MLPEILEQLAEIPATDCQLYFITRVCKEGQNKRSKVLNRYDFKLHRVDISPEIQELIFDLAKEKIGYHVTKETPIEEYAVIGDDPKTVLTYHAENNIKSFMDVINNQFGKELTAITDLSEITSDLWAYSIRIANEEFKLLTFTKIAPTQVVVDEDDNKKGMLKKMMALFSTDSKKLEMFKGEAISIDKNIDCIFYTDNFYIFSKNNFERIVNLEEEFKATAKEVVNTLKKQNFIENIEVFDELIEINPAIHRKLVRIAKHPAFTQITPEMIDKMKEYANKDKLDLNVNDNKFVINGKDDVELVLRFLCDYYKESTITGKVYGSYSGRELEP